MKTPNVFALTRREQRVVILIVLALIAGSVALHYRDLRTPMPSPKPASAEPTASVAGDRAGEESP